MSNPAQEGGNTLYMSALLVAVIVVTAVVIVLLRASTKPVRPLPLQLNDQADMLKKEVCSSQACTDASKRLLTSMSRATLPCQNFYRFVCEGWQEAHPHRHDAFLRSVLTEAELEVKRRLMFALETASIPRRNQSQIEKLIALYRSCSCSLNPEGDSVISITRFFKDHYQTWPHRHVPDVAEFLDYIMELDIQWRLNIFYRYRVEHEPTGRLTVSLFPYAPTDPGPAYRSFYRAYQSLVSKVATMFGGDGNYAEVVDAVVSIEAKLASMAVESGYATVSWSEISAIFPETTSQTWLKSFKKYHPQGRFIRGTDIVYIHSPHYIKTFLSLLLNHLQDGGASWYVNFRFILTVGCKTSYEIRRHQETSTLWPTGDCQATDVHNYCRNVVQFLMKPQWKGLITKVLLSSEAVFDVMDITKRIRNTFEEKVRQASWMDSTTRIRAFSKLESLRENLPKFFVFDGKTPEYERYSRFPDFTPSFLDNWLALRHAVGELIDSVTPVSPLDFNIAYDKLNNVLNVSVDMLSQPVYSYGVPAALNYAGLGAIVAREYTHAFDFEGGQMDGVGKYNQWWSNNTIENYELRLECFAAMLRKFIRDAKDMERVLPNVAAESSAVRLAYFTLKTIMQESRKSQTLHAMGSLSSYQLFFTNYCYLQCQNVGRFSNVVNLKFGKRSIGEITCNVAMMNMEEFSEAYECSSRSKMNWPLRCRVW
ncbi:endothelin-converting enzyme homolog [Ornithodoros turicata]|uniref:endothelin-converting enzyme homolog n=1 Tax=Ornithodoros turicata TaxID=34597 RepID=UPI003139B377